MPIFGALQNPTFNPSLATIVGVTQSLTLPSSSIITTDFAHTFIAGQYIKFLIPDSYGMTQLNGMTGLIIFTNTAAPTSFIVNIDTSSFNAFVVPANPQQSAQAIPAGVTSTKIKPFNTTVQTNTPYPPYGCNVNVLDTPYPPYPNPSPLP